MTATSIWAKTAASRHAGDLRRTLAASAERAELAERQWTFLVRKNGDDWRIDSVKTG